MVQGDSYKIDIDIKNAGEALDINDVDKVEIVLQNIIKTYPQGGVTYSDGTFHFPLTQQETMKLSPSCLMQVRVKFVSGDVIGSEIQNIEVKRSISKVVL